MSDALETLYALRLKAWLTNDKALYWRVDADIKSLQTHMPLPLPIRAAA